ncbi:MAG: hypothetical protein H6R13_1413 [Proteobacteria bacterium]|nr:hypothetical protein [Pseudomonadota bacterium]
MTTKSAWEAIPLAKTLAGYTPEWDRLNQRLFDGHPMFDSRFVDCLLKYFGDGREQLLRLKSEGGADEGLCLLHPGHMGIWGSFFPAQTQAAPVLLKTDTDLMGVFGVLPRTVNQIDFLGQDPDYSPVKDSLTKPRESIDHAKTISIKLSGSFESYWNERSKNLTKNIKRYRNRIEQSGAAYSFVSIESAGEMEAAVTRYGHLETSSWKGREGTAVAPDNQQGEFYAEMMQRFAGSGNAIVYELWIDDRLAASRLVISSSQMLIILKTAYDESMSSFAPGRLLLYEVIRDSFNRIPGGTIEFYTNATQDQLAWATHHRVIAHQTVFRNEAYALLRQAIKFSKRLLGRMPAADLSHLAVESFEIDGKSPTEPFSGLFADGEKLAFDAGWPWFENLAATVSLEGYLARIYGASHEGQPRAVLPVAVPSASRDRRIEALGNFYTTLYQPLVSTDSSAEDVQQIVATIASDFPSVAEMRFAPLDPEARSTILLRNALQAAGWVTFNFFCFGNWYLPVAGTWRDYLETRSGELRSTIHRMGRKLGANGGRLEIVTGGDRLEPAIQAFAKVYAASWKKPEPHSIFVPGLIRMLAATNRLRLGVYWLEEEAIAAQIWIVNNGKASIYKLAYDERFASYSPGTVLAAGLMECVIDRDRVHEVDYLIGDDPYKKTWMTHRRERWGIVAYRAFSLRGSILFAQECLTRAAKGLLWNRDGNIPGTHPNSANLSNIPERKQ